MLKKSLTIESSDFCRDKFMAYLRKILYKEAKSDKEARLQDFIKGVISGYRAEMSEEEENNNYLKEFFQVV